MSPTTSPSARPIDATGARSRGREASGVAHIGCSGWHYKSWRGLIYPADLPTTEWLRAYTKRFSTVELNNSFYRLPSEETFANWREQVPRGFLFAVKASRFLTHIKRLRDPEEPLQRLLTHAKSLGPSLGPLLFQIPPRWFPDPDRLETFLTALPDRVSPTSRQRLLHVLEMRDPRGYEPWVLELLRQYRVALCVHDMRESESPLVMVGPIVYIRFHGYGTKYGGSYPDEVLDEWAMWIRRALATGRDVYAYFNNDINGYAVYDAERLRLRVEGEAALDGRSPMAKPQPQQNTATYPTYPTRHGRRSNRHAPRQASRSATPAKTQEEIN
jgi:uncharacterized protein YecE (DUF72 family)